MGRRVMICISILVFAVVSLQVVRSVQSAPYNSDEVSWFFHTAFFDTLFLKHDTTSSLWSSQAGYDHPQTAKYLFGAYLYIRNPSVFSARNHLEAKYGRWDFYRDSRIRQLEASEFIPYITRMRELNAVFTIGALICLFTIMVSVGSGLFPACIALLAISSNPLFIHSMIRATADAGYVFFGLLALVLLIVRRSAHSVAGWVAIGIALGISITFKLAGLGIVFMYGIYEAYCIVRGPRRPFLGRLSVVTALVCFVWFVTNPTLYGSPLINSREYVYFRIRESEQIQRSIPSVALTSVSSRFHFVFCELFDPSCSKFSGVPVPELFLNAGLCIAGIALLGYRVRRQAKTVLPAICIIFALTVHTFVIPLYSDRYLLLPLIFQYIAQMIAIDAITGFVLTVAAAQKKRIISSKK